jgi:hypothetical protein
MIWGRHWPTIDTVVNAQGKGNADRAGYFLCGFCNALQLRFDLFQGGVRIVLTLNYNFDVTGHGGQLRMGLYLRA